MTAPWSEQARAIRERLAAATPGPWVHEHLGTEEDEDHCVHMGRQHEAWIMPCASDADLIAHAPEDLAAALDRIATLERVLHRAQPIVEMAAGGSGRRISTVAAESVSIAIAAALAEVGS